MERHLTNPTSVLQAFINRKSYEAYFLFLSNRTSAKLKTQIKIHRFFSVPLSQDQQYCKRLIVMESNQNFQLIDVGRGEEWWWGGG